MPNSLLETPLSAEQIGLFFHCVLDTPTPGPWDTARSLYITHLYPNSLSPVLYYQPLAPSHNGISGSVIHSTHDSHLFKMILRKQSIYLMIITFSPTQTVIFQTVQAWKKCFKILYIFQSSSFSEYISFIKCFGHGVPW